MIFFSQECISVPHLSFRGKHFRLKHEEKESTNMMEFLTGVKEQETLELTTLLTGDYEGQSVKPVSYTHLDVYKRQYLSNA